ncbi:MAG: RNA-binding protein [Parachlamydiales bacterium]|nr:RNA-binding protein [Parachlamydiales bacterium]
MKLYVGNLPHSYKEDDVKELFSKYSSVESCKIITDRDTGRSKGFAFVEFGSREEAEAAIQELNGKDCDGRAIIVNEARPKTDTRGGSRGGPGGGFNKRRDRY